MSRIDESRLFIPIGIAVLTVSDTRSLEEDKSGKASIGSGYTYSGHPACCAAALKNIEIMEREDLINRTRDHTAPLLAEKWAALNDHPIVGEAKTRGLLAKIELVPEKPSRKRFDNPGAVGTICRDHCFANGVVLRAVRDTMVASPPLILTDAEIDELVEKTWRALDATWAEVK